MRLYRFVALSILGAVIVAGCAAHGATQSLPSSSTHTLPQVAQTGNGSQFVEFLAPSGDPRGIAIGPLSGQIFFTEGDTNKIATISESGTVVEYPIPTSNSLPIGLAVGPDGGVWFVESQASKVAVFLRGTFTEYPTLTAKSTPEAIVQGPDRNMWFTEETGNRIGRISTNGTLTEFIIPTANSKPVGITVGSDANLWFVESGASKIGRITTAGVITEFASGPGLYITTASDGNLWYTDSVDSRIGRMTTAGVVTTYTLPAGSRPWGITKGPDGNPWWVNQESNTIQSIDVGSRKVNQAFAVPTSMSGLRQPAEGPDGNVWFTEGGSAKIGVLVLHRMAVIPNSITLSGVGQMQTFNVVESGYSGEFSASSANAGIATVSPSSGAVTFTVTATGTGSTTITVTGTKGNTVQVSALVQ
jgi:virginiamycin B lyase